MTGTNTERYITYASVGCNVGEGVGVAMGVMVGVAMGVMVGVAMGVMVGVANAAVRESVVATKRKQRNMVKMHFHWFACVHSTCTATK